ncbi:MAG: ABC transporter permease, partial [Terracoccus sp.]
MAVNTLDGAPLAPQPSRRGGPRRPRRRGAYVPYLLLLPGMLWLVVFFLVPMLSLASQSLQTGDVDNGYTLTFNFATYFDALGTYWPQLLRSLIYAGTATVATLALGFPLAWFIAHRSGRYKNFLLVLVIAPFFTSFLIRTLAWQTILGDTGLLAQFTAFTHTDFLLSGFKTVLRTVGL